MRVVSLDSAAYMRMQYQDRQRESHHVRLDSGHTGTGESFPEAMARALFAIQEEERAKKAIAVRNQKQN
jgi:hypothetical protein